jgi:hypothetical protein
MTPTPTTPKARRTRATPDPATAAEWSRLIRASIERTVASIMEIGHLLIACKAALPHGEYTEAVEGAGMSIEVAGMYARVARNKVLSNRMRIRVCHIRGS